MANAWAQNWGQSLTGIGDDIGGLLKKKRQERIDEETIAQLLNLSQGRSGYNPQQNGGQGMLQSFQNPEPRDVFSPQNMNALNQLSPEVFARLLQTDQMNQPSYAPKNFGFDDTGQGYWKQQRGAPPSWNVQQEPQSRPTRDQVNTPFEAYLAQANGNFAEAIKQYNADQAKMASTKGQVQINVGKALGKDTDNSVVEGINSQGKPTKFNVRVGADGKMNVQEIVPSVPKAPLGGAKSKEYSQKLSAFEANLNQYEKLLGDVQGGRLGGTLAKFEALIEQNPKARAAQGLENTLAGLVARIVNGEVGVMTDQDIERAKTAIPKITDTIEERKLKISVLREILAERKKAFSSDAQKPVDDPLGLFK